FLSTEKNTVNTPIRYSEAGKIGYFGRFTGVSGTNWKWVSVTDSGAPMSKVLIPVAISVGAMVVLALICIFIGFALTNSIVSPMKVMINDMREIKEGNREKRSEINARNELKDMSLTFNGLLDEVCLSEELHKTISDISDNMLFEWDFSKERMYVSDNFTEKFDINPAESQLANGKFLDKMMNEQHADQYKRDISSMLKNRTGHSGEYQMTTRNGSVVWFTVRAQCITDRLGEPLRVVGVVTDIDSEKKLELQLSERASYDFLSQLYNRSTFEKELQSEIERSAHSRVGLMFIDVDDFKFINDRFGHSVGDEVIRYVASSIKTRVKGTGFAGRFGGDEFVLCITDPAQIKDIENLALDLIDELYTGYRSELANVSINIKASVGIAFAPEHGENGKQIVAAADEAMYFVKKNGKANYHIYQPEDSQMEDLQHTL
ncbi:MAG: diguanylate cyclase, partial [Ruminiclostridium sp.]|nr:diguanylate cyclase [Ruminiclostridium sp.]